MKRDDTDPDLVELRSQAVAIILRALDEGSVDVALRVLALDLPKVRSARRRRRQLAAGVGVAALLAVLAGTLIFQSLEGGTAGESAPPPMTLGAIDVDSSAALDGANVDSSTSRAAAEGDPPAADAAADPSVVSPEVLGATLTTPGVGQSGTSSSNASRSNTSRSNNAGPVPGGSTPATGAIGGAPATGGASPVTSAVPGVATTVPGVAAPRVGALDGSWSAGGGSQAGYRVNKTWTIGGSTEEVVGRTSRVGGALVIAGDRLTAANVVIDMGSIDSGNLIRDAAFRQDILQTGPNPDARFDLTSAIDISSRPSPGEGFAARATGRLRIRGVTRDVGLDLQARQIGRSIQVVGSLELTFADFGIPSPSFALATVADRGTMEFSVTFTPV